MVIQWGLGPQGGSPEHLVVSYSPEKARSHVSFWLPENPKGLWAAGLDTTIAKSNLVQESMLTKAVLT